jgi:MSHA biogenesis protein MshI
MGAKGSVLALSITDRAVRYVLASHVTDRSATIDAWGVELRENDSPEAFIKRVKSVLPSAKRVIAVLDPEDYQIVQAEAPDVPAEEIRDAVRWRAMEFLGIPPDDLTIDVLTLSEAETRAGGVFAIAAQNELVRARMQTLESLGMEADVIDIAETAQRNLLNAVVAAGAMSADVAGALVAEGERALLTIMVHGEMLFFRRFDFDVARIVAASRDVQAALIAESPEAETAIRSLVQFHRSLDLWDDNFAKYPLQMLLVDAGNDSDTVAAGLKREVSAEVGVLNLSKVFSMRSNATLVPWQDSAYVPLLGALLRPAAPSAPGKQVNLFNPALLPPKRYFSARAVARSIGVAVVAVVAVAWWASVETAKLRKQVADQEARLAGEAGRTSADVALGRAQKIAALEQAVRSKQAQLESRRSLRDKLKRGMVTEATAHSALMRLVATSIPEQVWLTELRAAGHHIEVAGRTLDPLAFNAWMVRLGESSFFAAKPISNLKLENSEFATVIPVAVATASPPVAGGKSAFSASPPPGVYSFSITATPSQPLDDEGGKAP